jgi:hypothetical protein
MMYSTLPPLSLLSAVPFLTALHLGLVPIVEIPYAKYLDCASDMFLEAVNTHWLSNGSQSAGMLVRLQGFDKGVFGGNFHTHNSLSIPPGLDVVCYSNGADYVRGLRYIAKQVRAGRVVMCVDSTDLLNRRHLSEGAKDGQWLTLYPAGYEEDLGFDDIIAYCRGSGGGGGGHSKEGVADALDLKSSSTVVIVTYGNGVPTSLLAVDYFYQQRRADQQSALAIPVATAGNTTGGNEAPAGNLPEVITVIDCPCLSQMSAQLEAFLQHSRSPRLHSVIFADVCKVNSAPLSAFAVQLQNKGTFRRDRDRDSVSWVVIGASNTYNPLGNTLTFLSPEDVLESLKGLIGLNEE